MSRRGQAGANLPTNLVAVTVGAIAANADVDVVLAANPDFANLAAAAGGAPLGITWAQAAPAGISSIIAWISNAATGAVTVRFHGSVAGNAGGTFNVWLKLLDVGVDD